MVTDSICFFLLLFSLLLVIHIRHKINKQANREKTNDWNNNNKKKRPRHIREHCVYCYENRIHIQWCHQHYIIFQQWIVDSRAHRIRNVESVMLPYGKHSLALLAIYFPLFRMVSSVQQKYCHFVIRFACATRCMTK